MNSINVEHLEWRPDKNKKAILNDISITLNSGEIYGILGPNGAGKSSFVRQLCRLIGYDKGRILLDDVSLEKVDRPTLARKLSFLSQNLSKDVDFTSYDVVAMGREPYRKYFSPLDGEDKKIIEEAMQITDCINLMDKSITTLSGGELQRVMIARTIAQDTPWIILDEPVSSLDIKHQTQIMTMLSELHTQRQKTVIAILHDINLAARFCTRIILMKDGQIIAEGSTKDVLTKDNLKKAYDMEFVFINQPDSACDFEYIVPQY